MNIKEFTSGTWIERHMVDPPGYPQENICDECELEEAIWDFDGEYTCDKCKNAIVRSYIENLEENFDYDEYISKKERKFVKKHFERLVK